MSTNNQTKINFLNNKNNLTNVEIRRLTYPKWKQILIDIFAGTIAGINITIVGHPFDTLKVRLQTQPNDPKFRIYNGLVDCLLKTIKLEGFRGLYSGVQSPLLGQMYFRAALFLLYGEAKRFFSDNGKRKIKPIEYFYCGTLAWSFGTIIECPIDFYKTQLQVQIVKSQINPNFTKEYSGFFDCFFKIFKINGFLGAYQGFTPHLIRNFFGGAIHLGTFEYVRIKIAEKLDCEVKNLPIKYNVLAGSCGGLMIWMCIYPLDVVKSSIQADYANKKLRKYSSTIDCVRKLVDEGGYKRFFKGLSPCMIRAAPANGVLLLTTSFITENL